MKAAAEAKQKEEAARAAEEAAEAPEEAAEAPEEAERTAAFRYAQRRRFGPFRFDPEKRAKRRIKDIAAMARAGFPLALAISVIDEDDDQQHSL